MRPIFALLTLTSILATTPGCPTTADEDVVLCQDGETEIAEEQLCDDVLDCPYGDDEDDYLCAW